MFAYAVFAQAVVAPSDPAQLTPIWAIVILLILREVFAFVSAVIKKRANGSGEMSVDYWKTEIQQATATVITPVLARQTEILGELRTIAGRQTEMLLKLQFTSDEVKDGQASLRNSIHDVRGKLQAVFPVVREP